MTGWYVERAPGGSGKTRSGKAVIAATLLALLLVTAVPAALVAAVILTLLGHFVGGLALFGGSVLAAVAAITLAGMSGMRHLRKLLTGQGFRVVPLDGNQEAGPAEPPASGYADAVRLDRSEYTEIR
jgi:hypothetical protein